MPPGSALGDRRVRVPPMTGRRFWSRLKSYRRQVIPLFVPMTGAVLVTRVHNGVPAALAEKRSVCRFVAAWQVLGGFDRGMWWP